MKNRNKKILGTSAVAGIIAGLAATYFKKKQYPPLAVAQHVNLEKYAGEWYEIARLPARFEKDCHRTKAVYTLTDHGAIQVVNSCHKGSLEGKLKTAKGKAFVVDKASNAKLKVQFFWPFKGDYWILDVSDNYEYALVGEPSRKNMWILSRSHQISLDVLQSLTNKAKESGFDTDKLIYTPQME